eukprot:5743478-Pyramimonas_sp.AAC.1
MPLGNPKTAELLTKWRREVSQMTAVGDLYEGLPHLVFRWQGGGLAAGTWIRADWWQTKKHSYETA